MMTIKATAKYQIIQNTINQSNNIIGVSYLCETANISRSGYYHYLASEHVRLSKEEHDKLDFIVILEAYHYKGYNKGARSIYMRLLHQHPPIVMNVKKIRRLMKKFGLKCPTRKPSPYRKIVKNKEENYIQPNLVNRKFEELGPRKVLLTDITYILNGKAPKPYLSTIIDGCTKEVLAWVLSQSLEVDFVLETVNQLIKEHGLELHQDTMIHSDQGAHYTSTTFQKLVKDRHLRQSMSRRANCWDNAPQESFFGHMKEEIQLQDCITFDDVFSEIEKWIYYYNHERYQWDLAKLSPKQYFIYLETGIYPIQVPKPKGYQCEHNNES